MSFFPVAIVSTLAFLLANSAAFSSSSSSNDQERPASQQRPIFTTHPGQQLPILDGKLTPFWAQELVGGDLARQFVAENVHATHDVDVGIFDYEFDVDSLPPGRISPDLMSERERLRMFHSCSHGTAIMHLIAGDAPVGISARANFTVLVNEDPMSSQRYAPLKQEVLLKRPKIINVSLGINKTGSASIRPHDALSKQTLSDISKSTIMVMSAGNEHPEILERAKREITGAILVGSLSPLGTMSNFSSEALAVTIAAPSDNFIQTIDGSREGDGSISSDDMFHAMMAFKSKDGALKVVSFGGTSGAAPLVTGALANVLSFLPDLTSSEAKILLIKSAVPTPNYYERPRRNGAGMLNAYKIVKVAKRIQQTEFRSLSADARLAMLNHDELYDFQTEAFDELTAAKSLLANSKILEALARARASFLLNPLSEETGELLETIYDRDGLAHNARFYRYFNFGKKLEPLLAAYYREHHVDKVVAKAFMSRPATSLGQFADQPEVFASLLKFITSVDAEFASSIPRKSSATDDAIYFQRGPVYLAHGGGDLPGLMAALTIWPEARTVTDSRGNTAAHLAARYGNFLEWAHDVFPEILTIKNNYGVTALEEASDIIKKLSAKHWPASIWPVEPNSVPDALEMARCHNFTGLKIAFTQFPMTRAVTNEDGDTPLHLINDDDEESKNFLRWAAASYPELFSNVNIWEATPLDWSPDSMRDELKAILGL